MDSEGVGRLEYGWSMLKQTMGNSGNPEHLEQSNKEGVSSSRGAMGQQGSGYGIC